VWQAYRDQGVVVWGIASEDSEENVIPYVEYLGLSFPILMDPGGVVHQGYAQEFAFPTAAYPQDWVIGTDGLVVYANNRFELGDVIGAVEQELSD